MGKAGGVSPRVLEARRADLAAFLASVGVPLVRCGRRHRHGEHGSLVFTGNAYYWNSRQEGGNAVDYLVRHMGMSFGEAVGALAGRPAPDPPEKGKPPARPEESPDCRRAEAWLRERRGVGGATVRALVEGRLLMQEAGTGNAVFPMYDERGAYAGAELHGTLPGRRFKGVAAGSRYGYGFSVAPVPGPLRYALFFESAVDVASFMDIKTRLEGKALEGCLLVSMAGLKPGVARHTLAVFGEGLRPVLCVDGDGAGDAFVGGFGGGAMALRPPAGKDWNEALLLLGAGR